MENTPFPPKQPYFVGIPGIWQFRCRPDLIEELDFGDSFVQSLPADGREYLKWLKHRGLSQSDFPLERIKELATRGYQLSTRYVIQSVIPRGRTRPMVLVHDANRCSVYVDAEGLVESIVNRAIEYAVTQGFEFVVARQSLVLPPRKTPTDATLTASWSIGYESGGSGLTTLLSRMRPENEWVFLKASGAYYVPKASL